MNAPQMSMNFRGCRDRAEAIARLDAWLDAAEAEMVFSFASRLLVDENNAEEFQSQILQLRGFLAANRDSTRADVRARFAEILDAHSNIGDHHGRE